MSHSTSSGGVDFLFSKAFTPVSLEVEHFIEGRLLLVKARFDVFTAVFINVYAPTNGAERKVFLEKVSDVLNGCATGFFYSWVGILIVLKMRFYTETMQSHIQHPSML